MRDVQAQRHNGHNDHHAKAGPPPRPPGFAGGFIRRAMAHKTLKLYSPINSPGLARGRHELGNTAMAEGSARWPIFSHTAHTTRRQATWLSGAD